MTDRITRRHLPTQLTLELGVTALGGSLLWWAPAPAEPLPPKTPSGDLLETVPAGGPPSFARKGGARVAEVYRYAAHPVLLWLRGDWPLA
jgi:hypothetical protein